MGGGGHREKYRRNRGGLDVKFYTLGVGHYFFAFPFINWKKGRRSIRVRIVLFCLLIRE